ARLITTRFRRAGTGFRPVKAVTTTGLATKGFLAVATAIRLAGTRTVVATWRTAITALVRARARRVRMGWTIGTLRTIPVWAGWTIPTFRAGRTVTIGATWAVLIRITPFITAFIATRLVIGFGVT